MDGILSGETALTIEKLNIGSFSPEERLEMDTKTKEIMNKKSRESLETLRKLRDRGTVTAR